MDDSELAADSAQAVLVSASARCSARLFTPIIVIHLIISMSIVVRRRQHRNILVKVTAQV